MKRTLPLALLLGLSLAAHGTLAQDANTTIIDRANQPAPPPPVAGQTDAAQVLGVEGADIGVQRIAQPRKYPVKLFINTDTQVYFTDNVLLQPDNNPQSNSDAVVFANSLSLRLETPSIAFADGLLTPSVGLSYQRYYHGISSDDPARDDLDFDSYSVPLSLRYRHQNGWEGNLGITAGTIYRLNGASSYENIYRHLTTSLGVRKIIGLDQNNLLTFGGTIAYAKTWADTPGGLFDFEDDRNDKVDYSLDAAYYYLLKKWTFNAYARVSIADYIGYQEAGFRDVNRRDTTFSLGASATYAITPWASARVFTSTDWRESTQDGPIDDYTYEAANLGLGVSLNFTF